MDTLRSSVERMRATPTTAMAQKTIGSRVSETVENQIVRQNFDRTTHRRSPTTVSVYISCLCIFCVQATSGPVII